MSLREDKNISNLDTEKPASRILRKHLNKSEDKTGRSQIRLAIDKEPFYGYTANDRSGMAAMSLALDIITDDGNSIGLQYHLISSLIRFNTSGEINFSTSEYQIKIEGRNLRPIYEYLLEHRLVWIQAALSEWEEYAEDETVINSITVSSIE